MEVLIKPLVTEKLAEMQEKGIYSFKVDRKANKVEIRKAVEQMYGVSIESVNTIIVPGKTKFRNTKTQVIKGRTSAYKKALVKVSEGEIIDFYSNI